MEQKGGSDKGMHLRRAWDIHTYPAAVVSARGELASCFSFSLCACASVTSTDASIGTWNRIDPQSFRRGVLNARRIQDCHKCLSHNG